MNSQIRVTCLLLLGMAPLGAQTGSEARRELRVTADLVVGFRLTVRPEGAARLINRVAGTTEMEYPVVVVANVGWVLTAARPSLADAAASRVEVLGTDGEWHLLKAGGTAVTVGRGQPTNGWPMVLRLRVRGAPVTDLADLRLMMAPSDDPN